MPADASPPVASATTPGAAYRRHQPETTALNAVVRDNLDTLYGAIDDGAITVRIPKHARKELEAYLGCSLLCRGFARLRCAGCGESLLVAFSGGLWALRGIGATERSPGPEQGGVHDPGPDALDEPRPLEDLLGEGARRGVVRAQEGEARAGVAGGDSGQELQVVLEQVVLEDDRVDGLRGHVDHSRAGVAEADEQEEQPLLVEARTRGSRRRSLPCPPGPARRR